MMTLDIPLGPNLTEKQAREIHARGPEATVFALLTLAKRLGEQQGPPSLAESPSTPSAMVPVYEKRTVKRRAKKPGRKRGHPGSRRPAPTRIDRRLTHSLKRCPHCQGPVTRGTGQRTRYTEDIPTDIQPVVTEHILPRYWCSRCRKRVEARVTEALPDATLGHRTMVLSAWLHYGLGQTGARIVDVFNFHLQMAVTTSGLSQMWQRLGQVLLPWYEAIREQGLHSAVLYADETGWRINGRTHWLWCASRKDLTYYWIDRRRSSRALLKFFRKEFAGVLVSDFWGAYNAVTGGPRQKCLAHLLRELKHVEKYKSPSPSWRPFAKKLRRLIRDAIRLWKREGVAADVYASRRACLQQRLRQLVDTPWQDRQARRLLKRLRRHQNELFTFLDHDDVPFDNNHAERSIRPAVIIRKNIYNNRSTHGADTQAILMSIYRTLHQRHHNPLRTLTEALTTYMATGHLPPLPETVPDSS